jgi:pSer/pThr/pTyr-binding forkhead associated (FHA) protein
VPELLSSPRAATASELKAQIDAERGGLPFLVYRDGSGQQTFLALSRHGDRVSLGREEPADVVLNWDDEVSRAHAELLRVGSEWILVDDGLSLNGSFLNGELVRGRRRLHDGDSFRLGSTVLLFRDPREADARATMPSADPQRAVRLSDAQRRVLISLCRPFKDSSAFVTPATNDQIAGELYLSVDAVKKHMRALFEKFGVEQLPQYEKRARLVERAFAGGLVSEHEL